jgi:small subunit ribosomal protein S6
LSEGLRPDRASPEEELMERNYEAMVIVDARLEEGEIQKAVDRFTSAIGDAGGTLSAVDRWGNRRFAYEIDHRHEGYYFVATFTAPQDAVDKLKRTVQISDEFIRAKFVRPGENGAETPKTPVSRTPAAKKSKE